MKILHVVPGLNQKWNGIAGVAKDIAKSQGADLCETAEFAQGRVAFDVYDEIWVHSNWWLPTLVACWRVIRMGNSLVRMTHANLDPMRYRFHGWKKRLVNPVERWLYRRTARVIVTCEAEKEWCLAWGVDCPIEIVDLKRFYDFTKQIVFPRPNKSPKPVHALYLGRDHPLKGVKYLERAIADLNGCCRSRVPVCEDVDCIEMKIVSDKYGDELEKIWEWTDVLVLPTLSENFGRVVAEALERGKPVITTDGAPAWKGQKGVVYLDGYRNAAPPMRVSLLKQAILEFLPINH
jgi:glycosyltransferase involved in cell wall biosynthesis